MQYENQYFVDSAKAVWNYSLFNDDKVTIFLTKFFVYIYHNASQVHRSIVYSVTFFYI